MRPSTLQSRLIDTYGTLCDETGLNRLPFAEARQLSIETLRHLIAWRQHVKKHADNESPPAFTDEPPGGWGGFDERGPETAGAPVAKKLTIDTTEDPAARRLRAVQRGTGRAPRQTHGIQRIAHESIVEDYLNQ